jgi:hypothetical protein
VKCFLLIHLDPNNYGESDINRDTEEHDSIKAARDSFWRTCDGERLGDEHNHEGYLFLYDPREEGVTDPYPDRILKYGPRGGVRMEPA